MCDESLVNSCVFLIEEGNRTGAPREDPLPDGHHREGLLWPPVHRPQPRQSLAGPVQTRQKTS